MEVAGLGHKVSRISSIAVPLLLSGLAGNRLASRQAAKNAKEVRKEEGK